MSDDTSKQKRPNLNATRLLQARNYILTNPTHSKSQCVLATGCSDATVARARRDLIQEGMLQPPRNAPPRPVSRPRVEPEPKATKEADPQGPAKPAPSGAPAKSVGLLDHAAMIELSNMVDAAVESGDDEAIHKKLIKQCLMFALRPDLHPDTRMSASQMYGKLKDMARTKELGPGKPTTYEDGVVRLTSIHIACGPEMVMDAIQRAFKVKETATDAEEPTPKQSEEAPPTVPVTVEPNINPPPPAEPPGAPNDNAGDPGNPWGGSG